jgi:hypothetical protein
MKPWISRCLPIFSSCALAVLIVLAFRHPLECPDPPADGLRKGDHGDPEECIAPLSLAQLAYLAYNFVLHFHSIVFCIQLALALWWMTKNIKAVRKRSITVDQEANALKLQDPSPSSDSDSETKSLYMLQDLMMSLGESPQSPEDRIIHAIILPNYMEDLGTLRETLDVLASHRKAKTQYEVGFSNDTPVPASLNKQSRANFAM